MTNSLHSNEGRTQDRGQSTPSKTLLDRRHLLGDHFPPDLCPGFSKLNPQVKPLGFYGRQFRTPVVSQRGREKEGKEEEDEGHRKNEVKRVEEWSSD